MSYGLACIHEPRHDAESAIGERVGEGTITGGHTPVWRLPRDLFRFTTTERAELHTAVMQVFAEANERLRTALTFDEVRSTLPAVGWLAVVDDDQLGSTLRQLVEWSLVDVTQDHAHQYATADEYERKNLRYSLTKAGEAAVAGVVRALAQLESTGALQTAVLDAIADRLAQLAGQLGSDTVDDRRLYVTLIELETHLDAMRDSTKQFNAELQRLLRDDGADAEVVQDVKTATITYLEEYVTNLEVRAATIAEGITAVEELGVAMLQRRALAGADLPALGPGDQVGRWLGQRQQRWEGLCEWFRPTGAAKPRVHDLRAVAQRAIVSLLRVLERLREQRRRPASTAADFRTLARWFAAVDSDDDAHMLFNAAFGLWPARHAHLLADDPEVTASTTAWAEAAAVPVSPLLRTRGRSEHVARTAAVRDTVALRRRRQAEAARERAEVEAAWRRLSTDGPVRLSDFARLDDATFARVLELLGQALAAAPDRAGVQRATTADGQLEVLLGPPLDGARAVLSTTAGTFDTPDFAVDIRPRAGAPATAVEQEASA
jgi:uncharacterized protein (TIGR02677 family)